MIHQPEHFEQLAGFGADFGKDDLCVGIGSGVDNAEQDRNADAVDDLGVFEIDDQRFAARVDLPAAFAFDPLAADLIQIIAGKHGGNFTFGANVYVKIIVHLIWRLELNLDLEIR